MNNHDYSVGPFKHPARKPRHSKLGTSAWLAVWLCAFALSANWTVKAAKIYLHDVDQVERFND